MKRLALLAFFLAQVAFADLMIEGTWSNPGGTFTFFSDGQCQISWVKSRQYITGTWELTGEMLRIDADGNQMNFEVQIEKNILVLSDERGRYVFQNAVHPIPEE